MVEIKRIKASNIFFFLLDDFQLFLTSLAWQVEKHVHKPAGGQMGAV